MPFKVKSNFCEALVHLIDAIDESLNYLAASTTVNYLSFTTFAVAVLVSLTIFM